MYEDMTYESLLAGMLAYALEQAAEREETLDSREGSMLWYGSAPAAVEGQNLYIMLDTILNETFADTATRPYLLRRARERGLVPKPASYAIGRAVTTPPEVEIPIGARFSMNDLNFVITGKESPGVYRARCETLGEAGNEGVGKLIPVEYIKGLESAELTEILIPGEEEQATESFRKEYLDSFSVQAFGGNIADYKKKVKALQGVGGVKVYPVWDGGGTVKLVVLDSTFGRPTDELVAAVQTAIDPETNHGGGLGLAPIGHTVTVEGVSETAVSIETTLAYQDGWGWEDVKPYAETAADEYFHELAETWAEQEGGLVVRVSAVEMRLLDCPGVLDVGGTKLNGQPKNLTLDENAIPVRGEIIGT
mgnify:FL=1